MNKDDIFAIRVMTIDGKEVALEEYRGKVLLIVNVASQCGFTPQYQALEDLYKDLKPRGFEVLAFPCNQFGAQEPGDESEIKRFCEVNYGVSFPLFGKVLVNGDEAHPLFKFLKTASKGILGTESIKWNFTKFLIDRSGAVIQRFAPTTSPQALRADVEALL